MRTYNQLENTYKHKVATSHAHIKIVITIKST